MMLSSLDQPFCSVSFLLKDIASVLFNINIKLMRNCYSFTLKEMSVQYRNVMFASVNVDNAQELAQIYHIKAIPTFQMFKQAQKVTVFSRMKRAICCYRSESLSEPIFELCGTDAKKLEEKIQELM
nr:thioredoxin domain-containing protein 8 isoform X2 [Kogia breviceps]